MIRQRQLSRVHQAALPLPGCACWCMGHPWGGAPTVASAPPAGVAGEEEEAPILTCPRRNHTQLSEMGKRFMINHFSWSNRQYRLSIKDKCFLCTLDFAECCRLKLLWTPIIVSGFIKDTFRILQTELNEFRSRAECVFEQQQLLSENFHIYFG